MSDLIADLKFALLNMRRNPGFTATALFILTIGIGANTAIFSFVNGVLLRPLPYPEPDRIVLVSERPPTGNFGGFSTPNYLDLVQHNTVFEALGAEDTFTNLTLNQADGSVPLSSTRVTAHYFEVMRAKPLLGRTFVTGEDQIGHDHVAILSYSFWARQFGADPSLIGRSIPLSGGQYTVVGVFPPDSVYERANIQVWTPLPLDYATETRDLIHLQVRARLKSGVALDQARAQMDAFASRLAHDFPASNQGWKISVDPMRDLLVDPEVKQSLYLLLTAVGFVLLIACANLANLSLARGLSRHREVAIRAALGAGRWRLIRQFFTESMLVCAVGGLLGILTGSALTSGLRWLIPAYRLPAEADVRLDGTVLAFAVGITLAAGVISGLVPAVQSVRFNLAGAMKQSGPNSSADRQGRRLRQVLVVAEVALAFLLLAGAGLLMRSFAHLQQIEVSPDPGRVLLSNFPIPAGQRLEPAAFLTYLRQITDKLSTVPGVKSVAIASNGPLQGGALDYVQVAGRPGEDAAHRPVCRYKVVTPSYFATIGIRAIRGRLLEDSDRSSAPPVVVINERMAEKYFPHDNPLGQHLLMPPIILGQSTFGRDVSYEVVGIVTGERNDPLTDRADSESVYVPLEQDPIDHLTLAVRTSIPPALIEQQLVGAAHEVNRDQTLPHLQTLEERKVSSLDFDYLRTALLGTFAGVALTLAVVGIYGVLSYTVMQRTREIGIRMALGSTPRGIFALTLREGMTLVGAGLALGFTAALNLDQLLKSVLVGVEDHDPVTLASAALILAGASFLACYLPARRAVRINPLIALLAE